MHVILVCTCIGVCVCERERERESKHPIVLPWPTVTELYARFRP